MKTEDRQYKKVRKSSSTPKARIAKFINKYGLAGWELFSIHYDLDGNFAVYHFRNPPVKIYRIKN